MCDDDDSLVDAVRQVGQIDRTDCRRWVEEHFSVERMTANYERVFEALTTDHTDSPAVTTSPQAA